MYLEVYEFIHKKESHKIRSPIISHLRVLIKVLCIIKEFQHGVGEIIVTYIFLKSELHLHEMIAAGVPSPHHRLITKENLLQISQGDRNIPTTTTT